MPHGPSILEVIREKEVKETEGIIEAIDIAMAKWSTASPLTVTVFRETSMFQQTEIERVYKEVGWAKVIVKCFAGECGESERTEIHFTKPWK